LVGPNRGRAQVAFVSDPQPTGVVAHLNDPTRPHPSNTSMPPRAAKE
jgi:hypothetical protein